jgi:hypothetical protein
MKTAAALTPSDIRAALARLRYPVYQLAARIEVHPVRLSPMLHERVPLPARIAERIARVLAEEAAKS